MKRLHFAFVALTLVACSKEQTTPSAPAPAPETTAVTTASAEPTPSAAPTPEPPPTPSPAGTQKENSPCGGFAGRRCAEGLECHIAPPIYPDKSGICLKKK